MPARCPTGQHLHARQQLEKIAVFIALTRERLQMQVTAKSAGPWKALLALLVGAFLIGTVASLCTAARRVSRVVDTDYYNHGLHYDQTSKGARNPGMDWSMSASLAAGELQVRVKDQSGAPVAGGRLSFQSEQRSTGRHDILALAESAPGVFHAKRPASTQGELHGTLQFTRGDAAANHKLVLFY
jgi:hypothetical protein